MGESSIGNKDFMGIDDILNHLNAFGRFQKLLITGFCFMMLPVAFPTLVMYFAALEPTWRCIRNGTLCTFNGTFTSEDRRRCVIPRSEWEFTGSIDHSIVTQFDIFCEQEWMIHLAKSILFLGWAVGAIMFGWVADNFGRKITFFPSLLLIIIIGLLSSFSPNIVVLTSAQFLLGFFVSGSIFQMQIWMSEYTTLKYRPVSVNIIRCFFPFACAVLGVKAYFIREWKTLVIVCTAPYLFTFLFIFFIPESIHWLHEHQLSDALRKVVQRIASVNKKQLPTDCLILTNAPKQRKNKSNPLDLFYPASTANKTCILGYAWFIGGMTIFGLTFAAGDLGGSLYLNFILISLSEIPGIIAQTYLCRKFGHKKTACISTITTSMCCFAIALTLTFGNITAALRTIGILGKIFSSISFSSIVIWSFALFPTRIRAQAIGFLQVTSRIGASMAPWITEALRNVYHGAPFLVMGASTFISACLLATILEKHEDEGERALTEEIQDEQDSMEKSLTQF